MIEDLPESIAAYVRGKNLRDADLALSGFAGDATVRDESHVHKGHTAIRRWMAQTAEKYSDHTKIKAVAVEGESVRLTAEVSGTFPGSPVTLTYRFKMKGGLVQSLEIGS